MNNLYRYAIPAIGDFAVGTAINHFMRWPTREELQKQLQESVGKRLRLRIQNHNPDLPSYRKGHTFDAGIDLYVNGYVLPDGQHRILGAGDELLLGPHETKRMLTNISVAIPVGLTGDIRPRSSTSKRGILVHYGTVDPGYRGIVMVTVTNLNNEGIVINQGERIAQLVVLYTAPIQVEEVDKLPPSVDDRGEDGHGSTGR